NERLVNFKAGLQEILGSSGYAGTFAQYGDSGAGYKLMSQLLGDQSQVLKMTETEYKKMRKDMSGRSDFGLLLQSTESVNGEVKIKDSISSKTKKQILNEFNQSVGGQAFELEKRNAAQLWDEGRGQKASTIQDFAVAVAKGISISKGNSDLSSWNPSEQTTDPLE